MILCSQNEDITDRFKLTILIQLKDIDSRFPVRSPTLGLIWRAILKKNGKLLRHSLQRLGD